MQALLVVERIVIESIGRKNNCLNAIALDTNLESGLLKNILRHLLDKNLLSYKAGEYFFNMENKQLWSRQKNSDKNIKEEINELLSSHVNYYFAQGKSEKVSLSLKKISLTSSEEKLLQAHLINLNSFVNNIEMDQKKRTNANKTYRQTVLFWGHSQYSKLVEETLAAV